MEWEFWKQTSISYYSVAKLRLRIACLNGLVLKVIKKTKQKNIELSKQDLSSVSPIQFL